jgi:uncharacterized protein (DUF488 family)
MNVSDNYNHYILTFGYGNRQSYDEFLQYLQEMKVDVVIDVRINPRAWSRKWYKEQIEHFCLSKNIAYISQTALGNTSGKETWIPPNQEAADIALKEVAEIAQSQTILLLCAEMNPERCHRKVVADYLGKLSSNPVQHLR